SAAQEWESETSQKTVTPITAIKLHESGSRRDRCQGSRRDRCPHLSKPSAARPRRPVLKVTFAEPTRPSIPTRKPAKLQLLTLMTRFAAILFFCAAPLFNQSNSGELRLQITDPDG